LFCKITTHERRAVSGEIPEVHTLEIHDLLALLVPKVDPFSPFFPSKFRGKPHSIHWSHWCIENVYFIPMVYYGHLNTFQYTTFPGVSSFLSIEMTIF